jgi:glucose dehydrogenase
LLYVCVANPAPVSNGTQRRGMNLFTNSVLALDTATGRLKAGWGTDMDGDGVGDGFFQAVHHDLWDFDWAVNPVLFESTIDGKSVKALASAGKYGLLFMLDRTTGKPLPGFSIVELPVTASTVSGEEAWPTQPFPFNPAGEVMAVVPLIGTDIPQSRIDQGYVIAPPYTPANTYTRQITAPSNTLGGSVGPASFNPEAGLLYVGGIDAPTNSGRSTRSFITAWNINTGSIVWGKRVNGNFSAGNGSAATAGGLVFFGESAGILHGVDGYTGEELWTFSSGVSGSKGAPLVYEVNGKQYVSIKSGNSVFTFSLPD